eukprot:2388152-Amphidinium_carterae.1
MPPDPHMKRTSAAEYVKLMACKRTAMVPNLGTLMPKEVLLRKPTRVRTTGSTSKFRHGGRNAPYTYIRMTRKLFLLLHLCKPVFALASCLSQQQHCNNDQ